MPMNNNAVVMELNSSHVILLTDEGKFVRVPVHRFPAARYIGQHVDMREMSPPRHSRWIPVAAACLLLIIIVPLLLPTPAQAWVTLDGSSSLEVLVGSNFKVLEVRPLNNSAMQFMEQSEDQWLDFSALLDKYYAWSAELGDDTILVTSTGSTEALQKFLLPEQPLETVLLKINLADRDVAEKMGVSAGRALLLTEAQNQGVDITPDTIKESNPFTAISSAGADVDKIVKVISQPPGQDKKKDPGSNPGKNNEGSNSGKNNGNNNGSPKISRNSSSSNKSNNSSYNGVKISRPHIDSSKISRGRSVNISRKPQQSLQRHQFVPQQSPPKGTKDIPPGISKKLAPVQKDKQASWRAARTGPPFMQAGRNDHAAANDAKDNNCMPSKGKVNKGNNGKDNKGDNGKGNKGNNGKDNKGNNGKDNKGNNGKGG